MPSTWHSRARSCSTPPRSSPLGDRVQVVDRRVDPESGRAFGVVAGLDETVPTTEVVEPPPLDEGLVRPWILPAVYERMRAGRGELLAELRPAYPALPAVRRNRLRSTTPMPSRRSTSSCARAQQIMSGYGGNVLQLTLGDKGAYLYGVFGSPIAHEDDAPVRRRRRSSCAISANDASPRHPDRPDPRSPPKRHVRTRHAADLRLPRRRGEPRRAADGQGTAREIYVDDRVRTDAGDAYIWQTLPDLQVKGKKGAVVAHGLTGSLERASRRKTRYELELVGRRTELARLDSALDQTVRRRRTDRRDRRRGRDGKVAAHRRVRPQRPPAWPVRRPGRVPVVRHERELLRLARDLASAPRDRGDR